MGVVPYSNEVSITFENTSLEKSLNIISLIIFLLTATIVFVNFITDIILAIMDPRIRKGVMGGG